MTVYNYNVSLKTFFLHFETQSRAIEPKHRPHPNRSTAWACILYVTTTIVSGVRDYSSGSHSHMAYIVTVWLLVAKFNKPY